MNDFTVTEKIGTNGVKIAFVGIGTTGIKALNIISNKHENIKTIAIDTHRNSLEEAVADKKIELSYKLAPALCQCPEPVFIRSLLGKSKEEIDAMRK